jgi:hypothetical protein
VKLKVGYTRETLFEVEWRVRGEGNNPMNTFIVYTEHDAICSKLNINLWNSRKNKIQYLDFGFMIEKGVSGQSINLIAPFELKRDSVEDLNSLLIKEQKVCEGIFNTLLEYSEKKDHSTKVKNGETKKHFYLPSLSSDILVSQFGENFTRIEIKIPDWSESYDDMDIYLRLRILNPLLSSFIVEMIPFDHSLSSAFLTNEIVDFRVNDIKLATDDEVKILRKNKCNIKDVHFLYIIDADEQVILTGRDYKSRFIEHNLWNKYVNKERLKKEMIAYHMKYIQSDESQIYIFMIKNQISRCSLRTIALYIFIVIIIAVFANFLTSIFSCFFGF